MRTKIDKNGEFFDLMVIDYHGTQQFTQKKTKNTPRQIHMEHHHRGLEDHVPFQTGDFVTSSR